MHDYAEGDGFDSQSAQELFVKNISLATLDIEILSVCSRHTLAKWSLAEEALG